MTTAGTIANMTCHPAFWGAVRVGLLLALFTSSLGACNSGSQFSRGSCQTNQDCASGQQCVARTCVAASQSGCMTDDGCPIGQYCDQPTHTCQLLKAIGCTGDSMCPVNMRCNNLTGVCMNGHRECAAEGDCSAISQHCDTTHQTCVECLENTDCRSGMMCLSGSCVDPQAGSCTTDATCGPPASVCVGQRCVAGCQQPGSLVTCGLGQTCSAATGRCTGDQVGCTTDASCHPPASICVSGQCIPGCSQVGGYQCASANACDATTGRCLSPSPAPTGIGMPVPGGSTSTTLCTSDASCQPPATICNLPAGTCVAGCQVSGCPAGQTCSAATGRCQTGGSTPPGTTPSGTGMSSTGAPLNAMCTRNADCSSSVCFDFGTTIGKRCVSSCGTSADCPQSFTCYDEAGAKMCVSAQLFNTPSAFGGAAGGSCTRGLDCHSDFCQGGVCVEVCTDSAQCGGGRSCKWTSYAQDQYVSSCVASSGGTQGGGRCQVDADCASGVCYGSGSCGTLCSSSRDCTAGDVCAPVNYGVCELNTGTCSLWQPNYVKACVTPSSPAGPGAVGTACTSAGQCRSGLCESSTGKCTDTCAHDADCPPTHVCGVSLWDTLSDNTEIWVNVCKLRGT